MFSLKLSVLFKGQVGIVRFPLTASRSEHHKHTPNAGVHSESGGKDAAACTAFHTYLSPSLFCVFRSLLQQILRRQPQITHTHKQGNTFRH